MRCTNKGLKYRISLFSAALACCIFLNGCSQSVKLEDAFTADRPGFGIQGQSQDPDISYFAKDLCVADEDVQAIEADASDALAACFFNLDTKEILYAKNIHDRLYPASTTKIMTALVALEQGDLDAQTTVSQEAVTFHESGVSTVKLKEGDVLTLRQLLYGLLVSSANDAANAIAEMKAGSMEQFVALMNEKAVQIGATNTHFVNPNGLHDEEHYTTAYDLYLMFLEAMKYDTFLEILKEPSYDVSYVAADGTEVTASWTSSNQFTKGDVTVPDGVSAVGGKTGTTSAAKSCLVQLFEDAEGQRYIAVILGCSDRSVLYQEMQSFLSDLNN
ncbi:MAG: D-alanyl-D-alanine carboxypeptidase [Lachnospiraceae bacterium]|nr:D-alanyl-D-alanine carboxypeptidase [Lachnospiraceae bacterium]